jgi:pyruvate,orthophosphate dikinase
VDGTAGEVYAGEVKTAHSEVVQVLVEKKLDPKKSQTFQEFSSLLGWADKIRKLDIRTNADTPEQVATAIAFGAKGIGLTRTEHMFFEGDRIDAMREMILAASLDERKVALAKLLPYQREDFVGIFKELKGLPATIQRRSRLTLRKSLGFPPKRSIAASRNCTSSTRCWVIADAAWESASLK